jgi:hypothetical protein
MNVFFDELLSFFIGNTMKEKSGKLFGDIHQAGFHIGLEFRIESHYD